MSRYRESKKARALRVESTDAQTFHWIILNHVEKGSVVFTDDFKSYSGLKEKGYEHATVHHSIGEYVKGEAHTNGVESFWALLKCGYYGSDKRHDKRTCREKAYLSGSD